MLWFFQDPFENNEEQCGGSKRKRRGDGWRRLQKITPRLFKGQLGWRFGQTGIRIEVLKVCLARCALVKMVLDFPLGDFGQIA